MLLCGLNLEAKSFTCWALNIYLLHLGTCIKALVSTFLGISELRWKCAGLKIASNYIFREEKFAFPT